MDGLLRPPQHLAVCNRRLRREGCLARRFLVQPRCSASVRGDPNSSKRGCKDDAPPASGEQPGDLRLPTEAVSLLASQYKALLVLSVLTTGVQYLRPHSATALSVGWRPRRHHRRMGQKSRELQFASNGGKKKQKTETGKKSSAQIPQQGVSALEEAQAYFENLWLSAKRRFGPQPDDGGFHMGVALAPARVRTGPELTVDPLVGYAAAAVVGGLGLILLLRNLGSKGRRRGPDVVSVRDRSLGGKMVEIPRSEGPRVSFPEPEPRQSPGGREAALAALGTAPTRTPVSRATERRPPERAKPAELPQWWAPPRIVYSNSRRKQEAQEEAQALVREMEGWKYAGQDFPVSSLLTLRQILGDTGGTVRARTDSGRDAMFRVGADMAASCAMDPQDSHLEGTPPQTFVAGLARDLGVPDEKAVNITAATVASKARSALVSGCASYREGDMTEVMIQLLRLAGLLNAFPPTPGSAEAEAVGASLQQTFTLEERQAIFLTYGGMDYPTAGTLAEMLGFDPELVMPQLHAHLSGTG